MWTYGDHVAGSKVRPYRKEMGVRESIVDEYENGSCAVCVGVTGLENHTFNDDFNRAATELSWYSRS